MTENRIFVLNITRSITFVLKIKIYIRNIFKIACEIYRFIYR